jgi:hypothetical protein
MATITSSVVAAQDVQIDGRIWVREVHTDSLGFQWVITYLAPNASGIAAHLAASAISVLANAVSSELANDIAQIEQSGSLAVLTFNYATLSQVIVAVRAAFPTATAMMAVNISDWLNTRSFADLQSAFGFANVAAYNAYKASFITPNVTLATSVRAAVGA